jgi:hypothetical protein
MSSSSSSLGVRNNPGMVVLGVVVVEAGPRGEELPAVAAGVGHRPGEVEALHVLQQVVATLLHPPNPGVWRISTCGQCCGSGSGGFFDPWNPDR